MTFRPRAYAAMELLKALGCGWTNQPGFDCHPTAARVLSSALARLINRRLASVTMSQLSHTPPCICR